MARYYTRTKSRLARTQSRKLMRQTIKLLLLVILLIYLLVQFGVPILIKMAVFIGNISGGDKTTYTDESTILVPPTLQTLPEATFSARLDISGFAQEDVTVVLFVNGSETDEVAVDNSGEFEFDNIALRLGINRLWVVARDDNGNLSRESDEVKLIMDNDPPRITLESPENNLVTNEDSIEVKGLIDEEASISINGQFVRQYSDNNFSKTISLNEGDNEIKIVAVDRAGNVTESVLKVTYSP